MTRMQAYFVDTALATSGCCALPLCGRVYMQPVLADTSVAILKQSAVRACSAAPSVEFHDETVYNCLDCQPLIGICTFMWGSIAQAPFAYEHGIAYERKAAKHPPSI